MNISTLEGIEHILDFEMLSITIKILWNLEGQQKCVVLEHGKHLFYTFMKLKAQSFKILLLFYAEQLIPQKLHFVVASFLWFQFPV